MIDTESIGFWLKHVFNIEEKDLNLPFVAAHFKEPVSSSSFLTNPQLLEVKRFQDSEYKIIGGKDGEGREAGLIIFNCITKDGIEFSLIV